MKKILFSALILITLLLHQESSMPQMVSAHELLPTDIVEMIKENPNLTVEELNAQLESQSSFPTPTTSITKSSLQKADTILGVKDPNAPLGTIIFEFIRLGIQHILEGPDHILFVLALLLVFSSIRSIIKLVSCFTIAHSITLILAGTGVLTLSSRIVEPLIALSISYVAIFSVFFQKNELIKTEKRKLFAVFFFGLFHGLGFAGLLQDFSIPSNHFLTSLISFNGGVEIGQMIILALVVPYILLFKNKSWYPTFIKVFSIVISQIGLIWFFERALDLKIWG